MITTKNWLVKSLIKADCANGQEQEDFFFFAEIMFKMTKTRGGGDHIAYI